MDTDLICQLKKVVETEELSPSPFHLIPVVRIGKDPQDSFDLGRMNNQMLRASKAANASSEAAERVRTASSHWAAYRAHDRVRRIYLRLVARMERYESEKPSRWGSEGRIDPRVFKTAREQFERTWHRVYCHHDLQARVHETRAWEREPPDDATWRYF